MKPIKSCSRVWRNWLSQQSSKLPNALLPVGRCGFESRHSLTMKPFFYDTEWYKINEDKDHIYIFKNENGKTYILTLDKYAPWEECQCEHP